MFIGVCFKVRKTSNLGFELWNVAQTVSCSCCVGKIICKTFMTHKCLGCGKTGHRLESCTSKGALEINISRAKLEKTRHKPGSRKNPGRQYRNVLVSTWVQVQERSIVCKCKRRSPELACKRRTQSVFKSTWTLIIVSPHPTPSPPPIHRMTFHACSSWHQC